MSNLTTRLCFLFLVLCTMAACDLGKGPECEATSSTGCFSISTFEKKLKENLAGKEVGYTYAISYKGTIRFFGGAGKHRTAADAPEIDANAFNQMYIASMNKSITTVALLRLLHDNNISIDAKIQEYLPVTWAKGSNIDLITFRHILTHTSGFRAATWWELYPDLKAIIANGVNVSDMTYAYQNTNFNMVRALIANMRGFTPTADDNANSIEISRLYREYVQQVIFDKLSISSDKALYHAEEPSVIYYPFPYTNGAGTGGYDLTNNCGAQGIYLSAVNYANFLNALLTTEKLLTATERKEMLDNQLGTYKGTVAGHGNTFTHGGVMPTQAPNNGAFYGMYEIFEENEINVVVLVNSDYNGSIQADLEKAYLDSWK